MLVNIVDLPEWRKQHPGEDKVYVKHGNDGVALFTFNYLKPGDFNPLRFGAYTASGDFMFIDSEGTLHRVFEKRKALAMINMHTVWDKQTNTDNKNSI